MDVSVVIPTYNRASLLPHTLRAVLAQSLPPREIIVVDDGSTDETPRVLADFDRRVQVITIVNSGSIVARNVGLHAARGAFIAFCDSDDLWRPAFLARMAALWQAEPTTLFGYANFQIVSNGEWLAGSKFDEMPPAFWTGLRDLGDGLGVFDEPIVRRLLNWQPFFPSALVAERSAFVACGGWDEGVGRTVGDDFGTVLRLGEMHPFGVVRAPLVGIRKHAGNFSASTRATNLGDANILEYVLASRPSLAVHADAIREGVAQRRRAALNGAFADEDFVAVRAIYKELQPREILNGLRLKKLVATLPFPLASRVAKLGSWVRSLLR